MFAFDHILLARDYSPGSEAGLRVALRLATLFDADVHVLHVDVGERGWGAAAGDTAAGLGDRLREGARELIEHDRQPGLPFDPGDVRMHQAVRKGEAVAPAVLRYAQEVSADLVVVGTHGRRGVRRMLLGSVAQEIVACSAVPVLTVRADTTVTDVMQRILVPVDFSERSQDALVAAKALAEAAGASLKVLHVIQETLHPSFFNTGAFSVYDLEPDIEERVKARLRELVEAAEGPDVPVSYSVLPGRAKREIVDFVARRSCDLVVMPTQGLTGLEHVLLGSVAEHVVRHAACPVLTLRMHRDEAACDDASEARHRAHSPHAEAPPPVSRQTA